MAKFPNMNQLLKMAQDMSKQMEEQLDNVSEEGNAGGGMVKVVINGHKNVVSLTISPEVVDPQDIEMLQDLIIAAFNDALAKIEVQIKEKMGGMMPGMPGNFPFPGL